MRAAGSLDRRVAAGRVARPELVELLRAALAAGPLELVAKGLSMRPALQPGDRVRLEARIPRRGEIVLAVAREHLVLHRALRRRGKAWLLQGDARRRADGWIGEHDILGVATARARAGGGVPRWSRLDGGSARAYGLIGARLFAWARRTRERLRVPVDPVRQHPEAGPRIPTSVRLRRGRGSLDDAPDRTRSAGRARRGEA